MAIILQVSRHSWKTRLLVWFMYALLLAGSVTMIYPFWLMLAGAVSSEYDFNDFRLIPKYLFSDDALLGKTLYERYGRTNFTSLAARYGLMENYYGWSDLRGTEHLLDTLYGKEKELLRKSPDSAEKILADYWDFKKTLPPQEVDPLYPDKPAPFREFLREKYSKEVSTEQELIDRINRKWTRAFTTLNTVLPVPGRLYERSWLPSKRPDYDDYMEYVATIPAENKALISSGEFYIRYLILRFNTVQGLNKSIGGNFKTLSELPYARTGKLTEIYDNFVKTYLPLRLLYVHRNAETEALWRAYLRKKVPEQAERMPFFTTVPVDPGARVLWGNFLKNRLPGSAIEVRGPEERFREFLRKRYGTPEKLSAAWGIPCASFTEIKLPVKLEDYHLFERDKKELRKNFFFANYKEVLGYLGGKSRAVWVTLLLIICSIFTALTVNPLAAYALSRGKQSISVKFLIFFLATMAFPAEVGMIPGFLLMRDLNLLNTLFALILPGMASGYSIFLLKGFFDSIPTELYEAADIDGAGEFSKFYSIALPMSKPILAVIALGAFNGAYGGFMWAFLVCQDPKMWTIMVWMYEFQANNASNSALVMAALALVSIPTLLMFIFCQKIIMRGIIVPSMK